MNEVMIKIIGMAARFGVMLWETIRSGLVVSLLFLIVGCRNQIDVPATIEFTDEVPATPFENNETSLGSPNMQKLLLTQVDNEQSFSVEKGVFIEIELDENLSTGYQWEIDEFDTEVVELISSEPLPIQDLAPGSGGRRRIEFRAVGEGTSRVKLKYWQPWEGESSIVERFHTVIVVVAGTEQ
jgi:predicted secreted protein